MNHSLNAHYAKLWDYGEEIKRSNPGSTVNLSVQTLPDGQCVFESFYVCFQTLKEGWLAGCRKVIGLDGCFLKGIAQGELLSAVGRDANNQVYPIAWAVVDVETTNNWIWFLTLLRGDLGLSTGHEVALISDQHKGLLEAVRQVLPNGEHRQCARHVYANFNKKWDGVYFKNLFWAAAKSCYVEEFDHVMDNLKQANIEAYNYLLDKLPYTWSRAYFQPGFDCDAVENEISECWNSMIKESRRKPIVQMLEDIRLIVMNRVSNQRKQGDMWSDQLCPSTRLKVEENKHHNRYWHVYPSGYQEFEVRSGIESFNVRVGVWVVLEWKVQWRVLTWKEI